MQHILPGPGIDFDWDPVWKQHYAANIPHLTWVTFGHHALTYKCKLCEKVATGGHLASTAHLSKVYYHKLAAMASAPQPLPAPVQPPPGITNAAALPLPPPVQALTNGVPPGVDVAPSSDAEAQPPPPCMDLISDLQHLVEALEGNVQDLTKAAAASAARVDQQAFTVVVLQEQVHGLQEQVNGLQAQVNGLQERPDLPQPPVAPPLAPLGQWHQSPDQIAPLVPDQIASVAAQPGQLLPDQTHQ